MSTPDPRFTIVSAVYNVAAYLPDFIASIDAQGVVTDQLEVIMVDDGSTDESPRILAEWQSRRPDMVSVLTQRNAGQAAARNAGIEQAHGEWITFIDPDDFVGSDYFSSIAKFADSNPSAMMMAAKREIFFESTGERGPHPLSGHFTTHNRLRDLRYDTGHFHGHAPCAFFRLAELRRLKIRFDSRIRPTFEDVHFCCRYLLHVEPLVGYVQSAEYVYRKRADRSSTLDRSWSDSGRYTAVPIYGYLPLLHEALETHGRMPGWLQTMYLYELAWYFRVEDTLPFVETAGEGEAAVIFNNAVAEIAAHLDSEMITSYADSRLAPVYRDVLLHSYRDDAWCSRQVRVDKVDMQQRTMRVALRFKGERPNIEFVVNGAPVVPAAQKIRDIKYFDRSALSEILAWLPFGTLRVTVDGRGIETYIRDPQLPSHALDSRVVRRALDLKLLIPPNSGARSQLTVAERLVRRSARIRLIRRRFGKSWVFMDRVRDADDSGEHLFTWARQHHAEVNSWFVIDKDTPDYKRLRAKHGRRVVPYGSTLWKLLLLNCEHVISSHADQPITNPPEVMRLTYRKWRQTFLQHGVTKDDLSRWLDHKNFDLIVTSTPAEYESMAGDGTTYRYTSREIALTGLPRFDLVKEAGDRFPPDQRQLILFAPTWRAWLATDIDPKTQRPTIQPAAFRESDFVQQWQAVLGSTELKEYAENNGLTVAVLLHPDLQRWRPLLDLPKWITAFSFEETDIREVFARARVVVTDYSSMAFNAAYIYRPVVYFQFDRERVLRGGHLGRRGYFDYFQNGFGPVASTAEEAVKVVMRTIDHGTDPEPEYAERIAVAFPQRDGKCRERTFDAIAASTRKVERQLVGKVDQANDSAPYADMEGTDIAAEEAAVDEQLDPNLASGEGTRGTDSMR